MAVFILLNRRETETDPMDPMPQKKQLVCVPKIWS